MNRYQNHLASMTYVKPGCLRIGLLRLTLLAIGLLARFWFNRGDLGGIPHDTGGSMGVNRRRQAPVVFY